MWFEIKVFSFFYHYYIMAEENIYYYISFLDLRSPSPSFYITFFLPFSRDWDDMVGSCFNELYMGSSNTLNMYLAGVNVTTAKFGTKFTLQLRKMLYTRFDGLSVLLKWQNVRVRTAKWRRGMDIIIHG